MEDKKQELLKLIENYEEDKIISFAKYLKELKEKEEN